MTNSIDTSEKNATLTGVEVIRTQLKQMPTSPGVYRMLDKAGNVLYVGKAKNLKNRVSNYTTGGVSQRIAKMVSLTASMEIVTTHTEAEALLLEANMINWILLLRADNIEQWSGFHGASIITPQEAYDIDGKMDDGLPARGHVGLTSNSGTTDCMMKPDGSNVTAQTDTDAVYELTATGNNCYLIFVPEELDF